MTGTRTTTTTATAASIGDGRGRRRRRRRRRGRNPWNGRLLNLITLGLASLRPSGLLYALGLWAYANNSCIASKPVPESGRGDAVRSIGERGAGMADMRPFTQDHCALSLGVPGELFVARPYDGGDVSESTRFPPTTACGQEANLYHYYTRVEPRATRHRPGVKSGSKVTCPS